MSSWELVSPAVAPSGECAPDTQTSDAYGVRWRRACVDGTWAVITVSFYLAEDHGVPYMERQAKFVLCSDPDDPGGGELWSDCDYNDDSRNWGLPLTDDGVQQAAARTAAETEPSDEEWNTYAPDWAPHLATAA